MFLITILWSNLATFVTLKLAGVIAWSWWLVLIPLWIHLGFLVIVIMIGLIARNAVKSASENTISEIGRGLSGVSLE